MTLALIRLLTKGPLEDEESGSEASPDLFNYSSASPFKGPRGWAVWAAIGVALSPVVVGTMTGLLSLIE